MSVPKEDAAIKRLRNKISQFKGQITRAARYATEQAGQVLVDLEGVQIRIEDLQRSLSIYQETQLELSLLSTAGDDDFEEDDVEERCFSVIVHLRGVIRAAAAPDPGAAGYETKPVVIQNNRLPALDIACFDGKDITQFSSFMDIFKAVIDKDSNLTAVQKLYYLKKYTQGDALSLINSLPLTHESYSQAIELLTKRYDNKCLVITHHVNALLDYQPISKGTASELRHLVSIVRQHIGALQNLGQEVMFWDMIIIPIISRKLDSFSRRAYIADRDSSKLPVLEDFLNFLEKRAMSFEESQIANGKSCYLDSYPNKFAKSSNLVNISQDKPSVNCRFCQSNEHKLFTCKKYQALSATDRIKFANDSDLCQICLNKHDNKCIFHFKCSVCKSKEHNSLLHCEDIVNNFAQTGSNLIPDAMVLLPTIQVKFRANDGSYITARGLVDSGSQVSFINSKLVDQLKVPTFNYNVNITALGQKQKPVAKAVNLPMQSIHDNYSCNAMFSVVENITSYLPQTKFNIADIMSIIPNTIKLADQRFNIPGEISFLVSADVFFNIMLPDKITFPGSNLCLLSTKFGYIVSGQVSNESVCLSTTSTKNDRVVLHATLIDENVDTLLQRFWEEQDISPEIKPCEDTVCPQDVCEIDFQRSVQLIDNRVQVRLPFKVPIEEVQLGDSFTVALQRLNSLCKRFLKDNNLKERYTEFINEILELGRAKVVDLFNQGKPFEYCYLMPHHAVLREDRVTTNLRTVFDASAKTNLKRYLNDFLYCGSVVQRQLFEILIQFRTYKYAAMTEIKQRYRQLLLDPSQTHLQLLLWKEHIDDPLLCLQLTRVIYGVSCSGYLATRCLVELAHRYKEQYPSAAAALINNTYCDDCLFGGSTAEEVKQTRDQLIKVAALGSFEFHKWCANRPEILVGIPKDKQYFKDFDFNDPALSIKALGLLLNIKTDNFIISSPVSNLPAQWTKRSLLSYIGTFFDPLGLAGPIVTKAKEFLQKVWKEKLKWDVCIPEQILSSWSLFFHELIEMKPIYDKSDLMLNGTDHIDLIGYCDAAFTAYASCIYIRAVHGHEVYVNLMCSKSKIAPIQNKLTIPKLELAPCMLLAKLFTKVRSVLQCHKFRNCVFFSDSQVALGWLQNPPTKDVFVKNRVTTVKALTDGCLWRHVSGSCNPADCLSREIMPSALSSNIMWWHGTPELRDVNFTVNSNENTYLVSENINEQHNYCNVIDEIIPLSKVSLLMRLQRIVCYVLRFINNCKLKRGLRNSNNCFSSSEYRKSMKVIVSYVQRTHFSEEIFCLQNSKLLRPHLKKMCLFLDSNKLFRVGRWIVLVFHLHRVVLI